MKLLSERNIIVGLDWQPFDSKKTARSAIPKGNFYYVRKQREGELVQAVLDGDGVSKKTIAGAMLLSMVDTPCAVLIPIDEENYWVCGATNEMPVPGFDIIASSKAEALRALDEIIEMLGSPVIYGDGPGSVGTFDDFLEIISPKQLAKSRIQKDTRHLIIIAAGIIAAILVAGASFLYIQKKVEEERVAAEQLAAQLAAEAAAKAAKQALDAHIKMAKENFAKYMPFDAPLLAWSNFLGALPSSSTGWEPSEANCDLKQCVIKWQRMKDTPPSTAVNVPGNDIQVQSNDAATSVFPIEINVKDELGVGDQSVPKYFNDLSVLNTSFTFKPAAPQLSGVPNGQDISLQVQVGFEGEFSVKAGSIDQARDFLEKIRIPGVSVTAMKVSPLSRTNYDLEISGKFRIE